MASESRGSYFCIIILCIISLPLVLIWFLASYSGLSITSWPQTTQSCQCQNDEPTLLPPVIKVFRSSRNLTAISIHDLSLHHEIEDSDQRTWEDLLLPSKAGSIFLEDEKSKVGPYGVSMFHQLHCLAMIRKAFLNAFAQENGEGAVADASMGKTPNPLGHLGHCFHYLAQGIICAADDTLEPPSMLPYRGMMVPVIDGVGQSHQCRDPSWLWDVVSKSVDSPWRVGDVGTGATVSSMLCDAEMKYK